MTGDPTAQTILGAAGPVRILLVDDQPQFLRAAAALIGATPGLTVIGEAGSGEHAVELAGRLRPDLIVMDVRLPGIDGTEATRRILRTLPAIRVVLVSTYDRSDLPGIDDCGAALFVRKQDFDVPALIG
jgi:DNA-binding NarL/FixJ family response regulator